MGTLGLTQAQIEDESEVTEADIALAVALWRRFAPSVYRSIIETDDTIFEWNQKDMTYTRNGVRIDPQLIRSRAIDPFINNVKSEMKAITAQLQRGEISLPEWQAQMNSLTKASQLAASLVANGGTRNTTERDYAGIALSIVAMLSALQVFAGDINTRKQLLNGSILTRTGLYASAARDAYEQTRRLGIGIYGSATEERRVLDPTVDNCTSNDELEGCVELAAMGWQPIGSLPRLYETPCNSNCHCYFQYR